MLWHGICSCYDQGQADVLCKQGQLTETGVHQHLTLGDRMHKVSSFEMDGLCVFFMSLNPLRLLRELFAHCSDEIGLV